MSIALANDLIIAGCWSRKQFRIIRPIGSGGFGAVYLVVDLECGTKKALKISRNMLTLVREFTILQRLHKYKQPDQLILKAELLDDLRIGHATYGFIVMEYLEGKNLKELVRQRRFTTKEVLAFGHLMGSLLGLIHRCGYVYCDVKPENVIFDEKHQQFRLVDFGGVREMGSSVVQFTPAYDRASYNCGLRRADPGYDIFALTGVMITLLTGKEPRPSNRKISGLPTELADLWDQVCMGMVQDMSYFLLVCQGKGSLQQSGHRLVYGVGVISVVCFLITVVCLL